jgi:mono/diheme cytochrome c family protein
MKFSPSSTLAAVVLVMIGGALAGCSSNDTPAATARTTTVAGLTGNAANGAAVFGKKCAGCHGSDGKTGSNGPSLLSAAADPATTIATYLIDGKNRMPSFKDSSDQELADLIAHVKTIK